MTRNDAVDNVFFTLNAHGCRGGKSLETPFVRSAVDDPCVSALP